jgi:hypothetical protein
MRASGKRPVVTIVAIPFCPTNAARQFEGGTEGLEARDGG